MVQVISHRARKPYEAAFSADIVCDHVSLHASRRAAARAAKAWFAQHPESFVALYEAPLFISPVGGQESFLGGQASW